MKQELSRDLYGAKRIAWESNRTNEGFLTPAVFTASAFMGMNVILAAIKRKTT
jgi:hypothetical protein